MARIWRIHHAATDAHTRTDVCAGAARIWRIHHAATLKGSRLKVVGMNGLTEEEAVDYLQKRGLWTEARADSLGTVARQASL